MRQRIFFFLVLGLVSALAGMAHAQEKSDPFSSYRLGSGDVISVFVVGEVIRPNEFVLRNGKNVTVTQAIALANGFTKDAKKKECVIIRYHRDGTKEEITADTEKILRGDSTDVTMLPNDILFVPATKVKAGLQRALDSSIAVAIGRIIYRGF